MLSSSHMLLCCIARYYGALHVYFIVLRGTADHRSLLHCIEYGIKRRTQRRLCWQDTILSLSIDDNVALGDVSSASFISYHREGPEWDQQHRQCNRRVWSQCDGQLSRSDLCWMQLHLIACKGHRAVGTAHPGGCYDECVFVSAWRSKHGHIVCPVVTSWTAHKGHSRSSVSNLSHPYQTELEIAATSTRPKKQLNGARVANWRFHHHPHATRIKPLSYNY